MEDDHDCCPGLGYVWPPVGSETQWLFISLQRKKRRGIAKMPKSFFERNHPLLREATAGRPTHCSSNAGVNLEAFGIEK
jgi:hypothetical protein